MDFESPDVMKDFPGLYASEMNKKCSNDSDYSDDVDKLSKKDILIGKRKEKKDKKDKERGYAALEGESSAEENNDSRSPSKTKKSKSFKFSSKSKEKREKSRDKEKEQLDKRKDKDRKTERKGDKDKYKSDKKEKKSKSVDDSGDIADALPIFGVTLDLAVERSRCHDGIDLPLPVRSCLDYVECHGLMFEGVYKIGGTKSKVVHLKKMYNHRENVNLSEYDIPVVTSLLKIFLRDMPEPVFTNDLLIRFEEAGAILNHATREKHLKILIDHLPTYNKLLLSWLVTHFDNVVSNEKINKMSKQHLAAALCPTIRTSPRLFIALLQHAKNLFPTTKLFIYIPPLTSSAQLPDDLESLENELRKQESLLAQIHSEMNAGFISKSREELLWEVQRITTQLKRKLKTAQKAEKDGEDRVKLTEGITSTTEEPEIADVKTEDAADIGPRNSVNTNSPGCISRGPVLRKEIPEAAASTSEPVENNCDQVCGNYVPPEQVNDSEQKGKDPEESKSSLDADILLLQFKNKELLRLKNLLVKDIEAEHSEISWLEKQLGNSEVTPPPGLKTPLSGLDEIMDLLHKENQILEIKKITLVRQIIEQQEVCIDLKAKLALLDIQ